MDFVSWRSKVECGNVGKVNGSPSLATPSEHQRLDLSRAVLEPCTTYMITYVIVNIGHREYACHKEFCGLR